MVAWEFPADVDETSTKGPRQVSSARAHGRADEAGPSLARDVQEASAGDGQAQSSVPTFFKRRKYIIVTGFDIGDRDGGTGNVRTTCKVMRVF